jgi:hypothetical protein
MWALPLLLASLVRLLSPGGGWHEQPGAAFFTAGTVFIIANRSVSHAWIAMHTCTPAPLNSHAELTDEGRLEELCGWLMGPPSVVVTPAAMGSVQPPAALELGLAPSGHPSSSSPPPPPPPYSPRAAALPPRGVTGAWEPSVLGLDKRTLLRRDVLYALSHNRALQRLATKYIDLLEDAERAARKAASIASERAQQAGTGAGAQEAATYPPTANA